MEELTLKQKARIYRTLIRCNVRTYKDLPESEKIPLRVSLAKDQFLDDLQKGVSIDSIKKQLKYLVENEQYSGAEGIVQAFAEFKKSPQLKLF